MRTTPPTRRSRPSNAGLSAFHFQRAFSKRVGVSPKQYALALRERRLEASLTADHNVTRAALDAGFAAPSAMYEGNGIATSMQPRTYRAGGRGERIVCAIALDDDRTKLVDRLRERFHAAEVVHDQDGLGDDLRTAAAIVDGRTTASELPLDIRGTAFERRVWRRLAAIPRGETRTYAQVAAELGMPPAAARAVANACASNGLAVAIPCHRVVRGDGSLAGYRWSVKRKRALLERERERNDAP